MDEKYYISDAMLGYFMGVNQKESKFPRQERFLSNAGRKNQDVANSITTNAGQRPTDNFIIEPFCVASRGRNPENPSDRTPGQKLEQRLEPKFDGTTNTITTVQKDNYVIVPNLKTRLCNELVRRGVVKGGEIINHSYTTSEQRDTLDKYIETTPLRIRKLTPLETWKLMGFDEESFRRAEKVNSNAQLYKQAGNSIVCNVLMAIFKNLL